MCWAKLLLAFNGENCREVEPHLWSSIPSATSTFPHLENGHNNCVSQNWLVNARNHHKSQWLCTRKISLFLAVLCESVRGSSPWNHSGAQAPPMLWPLYLLRATQSPPLDHVQPTNSGGRGKPMGWAGGFINPEWRWKRHFHPCSIGQKPVLWLLRNIPRGKVK